MLSVYNLFFFLTKLLLATKWYCTIAIKSPRLDQFLKLIGSTQKNYQKLKILQD